MRSRLQWIHGRGQHVIVGRNRTPEIFVKFLVLAGLLYLVTRVFYWGEWIPFAGASVYLLWELGRTNSALGELADLRNGQYRQRQVSDRLEYDRK